MRNIALIVRRELAAYLRTPHGYLIAAAVLIIDGLFFNAFAVGSEARLSAEVLERFFICAGPMTVIAGVLFSTRLLAEERELGTDVLLSTSPVREGEIVLGKYLSAVIVLSLLTLMSLYLPALIFVHGKVSWGHIGAGYLGMILLGASTLAVGTFASSLVSRPFLAVILTAVFVAGLELAWWVGQVSDEPLKTVISFVAPYYKHFQPFRRGLLQLSDVVFYASVIYLSLLASTRVLQARRWQ